MTRHAGWLWMLVTGCAVLVGCDDTTGTDAGGREVDAGAPADAARADASDANDAAADARVSGPGHDAATGATGDGGPPGPTRTDAGDDAGTVHDDAGGGDGGGGPALVTVAGRVLDAWTNADVASAQVSAEGSDPLASDTSNASGEYALELVEGELLTPLVTRSGHRPTRNPASVVGESDGRDVHVVSTADAARQYTGLGRTPTAGTALVLATLRDADGDPLEGIPLADITLVDGAGSPIGLGPYFFGAAGELVDAATLAVSSAYDGRARVGFLDCPPGEHELEVGLSGGSLLASVTCSADGATLVVPAE